MASLKRKKSTIARKINKNLEFSEYSFIDEIDKKILRTLLMDSRLSYREIARRNKLAVGTVIERLRKLKVNGVIKGYSIDIDPEKIGYKITAIIEIAMPKSLNVDNRNEITNFPNIYGVYDVTGTRDAFLIAKFKSMDEMNEFLKMLQTKPYVRKTETHVVLRTFKEDFRVLL